MKHPVFLSIEDVIIIHENTIKSEGGKGGVRDYPLLESANMIPQQQFGGHYLHEDLPAMAAAYMYHISQNHLFYDGNKRTGVMAAFVFLDINHLRLTAANQKLERVVMGVAGGKISKSELIDWMRKYTKEILNTK